MRLFQGYSLIQQPSKILRGCSLVLPENPRSVVWVSKLEGVHGPKNARGTAKLIRLIQSPETRFMLKQPRAANYRGAD